MTREYHLALLSLSTVSTVEIERIKAMRHFILLLTLCCFSPAQARRRGDSLEASEPLGQIVVTFTGQAQKMSPRRDDHRDETSPTLVIGAPRKTKFSRAARS